MIELRRADPGSAALRPLLAAHLEHGQAASPETSNHTLDAAALQSAEIRFWALFENGVAQACGALKPLPDGSAEVKSVHVAETARGRGLSRRIMQVLTEEATRSGHTALVLETGSDLLPEYDAARGLYESLGFSYCGPIPGYEPDSNSAFLRLGLDPEDQRPQVIE